MLLTRFLRESIVNPGITERRKFYAIDRSHDDKLEWQLERFNEIWKRISTYVPFYTKLVRRHKLPRVVRDWDSFIHEFPVITREIVQGQGQQLTSRERRPEWLRVTGGSTAQPIQLAAWHSEDRITEKDMWLARRWYGVKPSDKCFLIWGHSHLLGTGVRGMANRLKRQILDKLLGYYRFSAYDLSREKLRRAARTLMAFRPRYLIGYSVALDLFRQANEDLVDSFNDLGLQLAIGTAESFPNPESPSKLSALLGCHVGMEYGSVETGLIAHTTPGGIYRTFWGTNFIEASEQDSKGRRRVLITSLYPRCFPLIRYDIGDEIEGLEKSETETAYGISQFSRVVGRCNDYVELRDGSRIHSEVFSHCVRDIKEIKGYQVVQMDTKKRIDLVTSVPLTYAIEEKVRSRLAKIHPELTEVEFERVKVLKRTLAGKTRMVIRE